MFFSKFFKRTDKHEHSTPQPKTSLIMQNLPNNSQCILSFKTRDAIFDESTQKIIHNATNDSLVQKELTLDEKLFFDALVEEAEKAQLYGCFAIARNTFRTYTVDFNSSNLSCWVGRVNFFVTNNSFAVRKEGNMRVSKVFDSIDLAQKYIETKKGSYMIEERKGEDRRIFNYLVMSKNIDDVTAHELHPKNLYAYKKLIPHWIKYMIKIKESDTIY